MNESAATQSALGSRRIVYLVFATATLLVLGLIYAWSIFAKPIGKEFVEYGSMLSQVFQVSMFMFCISALFGAQLYKRTSPRLTIIVAAILLGIGFVASAFFTAAGIWVLIVFYGVIAASGVGIAYNAIISLINPWFPDKTGLCSGVMMMGFGISSLVFGSLADVVFQNPAIHWSAVFIVIAVVGIIIMVALALVVKPAPTDMAQRLGMKGMAAATKESPTKNASTLSSKAFWVYAVWSVFVVACGLVFLGSAAQGAEKVGVAAGFAALHVGIFSTMNGIGRIINGALFDKFGLVPIMAMNAVIALVSTAGISFAFGWGGQDGTPVLYTICTVLLALSYASCPVMNAAFARQRFKTTEFAKNLGFVNLNIAVGATINIIIAAVLGAPNAGNGNIIYAILAILSAVALVSLVVFSKVYKGDLARINEELQ